MEIVDINQAKAHLSDLVERAVDGEEIVIGKAGARVPGIWKGHVFIAPDFDELSPELGNAVRGEDR